MCLQCSANAKLIVEDIFPGWSLYQSQKEVHGWKDKWYGLVECNDPTFTFPNNGLVCDLCEGLTDEEVDKLSDDSPEWKSFEAFQDYLDEWECRFKADLLTAWRFVQACITVGYDPEKSGRVDGWALNYIARKIHHNKRLHRDSSPLSPISA